MEFPWRCNVDTIAMDLKVSWEMSAEYSLDAPGPNAKALSTRYSCSEIVSPYELSD